MKSGWRTSEFWLSAAALVSGVLLSSGLLVDGPILQAVGALQSILVALGYGWARTSAKNAHMAAAASESTSLRTVIK